MSILICFIFHCLQHLDDMQSRNVMRYMQAIHRYVYPTANRLLIADVMNRSNIRCDSVWEKWSSQMAD